MLISCPHVYRHFGFAGTTFTGERDHATTRGSDELGTAGEGSWIDQHCCIGLLFSFCQCFCGGGMDLPRASRHSIYFPGIASIVEYPVGQIFQDWRLVLPRIR